MEIIEAFPPELRLALALLSPDDRRRSPASLRRIVDSGLDWSAFVELVIERHRVAPLVWRRLRDVPGVGVPQPVRVELEAHRQANIRHHLLQRDQIIRVQRAMAAAGVRPILLKGLSIDARFYEHPGLRHVGDVDLLVSPADVARAHAALGAIGYDRVSPSKPPVRVRATLGRLLFKHFVYAHRHRASPVELHWRPAENRFLLDRAFWTELDGTTRLALSRSSGIDVLRPLAEFAYVSVHGAEHAWARLKWLADLCPMIAAMPDNGCERVVAFGRRNGLLGALLLGTRLARDLLGVKCPPILLNALKDDERIEYLTSNAVRALRRDSGPWPTEALPQIRKFCYEFRLRRSLAYRINSICLFPINFHLFVKPMTRLKNRFG